MTMMMPDALPTTFTTAPTAPSPSVVFAAAIKAATTLWKTEDRAALRLWTLDDSCQAFASLLSGDSVLVDFGDALIVAEALGTCLAAADYYHGEGEDEERALRAAENKARALSNVLRALQARPLAERIDA